MKTNKIKVYNIVCGIIIGFSLAWYCVTYYFAGEENKINSVEYMDAGNSASQFGGLKSIQSKLLRAKEVYKVYYRKTGMITNDFEFICDYLDEHNPNKKNMSRRLFHKFGSSLRCAVNGTHIKLSESIDKNNTHPEMTSFCQLEFDLKEK